MGVRAFLRDEMVVQCRRSSCIAAALLGSLTVVVGAVPPAGADQGPKFATTAVNEGTPPDDPWQQPEAATASDNVYAGGPLTGIGTTQYLKATGFGFSIPHNAVIEGIEVVVEARVTVVPGGSFQVVAERIVKGGVIGATDGSIEGMQPGPVPDDLLLYGGPTDLWGEMWTPADINAADFGFAFKINVDTSFVLVDSISITVFSTACGDGQVGSGEQCDDGNLADGDCCSSTCQFEPAGSPCPSDGDVCNGTERCFVGNCLPGAIFDPDAALDCDDGNLCTQDSCDPIDGCVHDPTPVGGCRTAQKSMLILKQGSPDSKDKLIWKWIKGQATGQGDFGVPTGTTQYALCIYAGTVSATADYVVPGDAVKWSAIATKGYKYKDASGANDGITKILLKGGAPDKSKCLVKGKGANLDDLALETLDDNGLVTVQLVNDSTSVCFESTFTAADFVTVDDPTQFKAKTQ